MKSRIIVITLLLIAVGVIARIIPPFPGWDDLKGRASSYIAVVCCGKPTPNPAYPYSGIIGAAKSDSEVHIIFVLKGTNNVSPTRLQTDHELRQGENYLVFGDYNNGVYQAWEDYRVVPLGMERWGLSFPTNMVAGRPLDEQIQILFQRSVDHLNHEIHQDQEEKERLEEGLQK